MGTFDEWNRSNNEKLEARFAKDDLKDDGPIGLPGGAVVSAKGEDFRETVTGWLDRAHEIETMADHAYSKEEANAADRQHEELVAEIAAAIEQAEARGRAQNEPLLGLATTRQLIDELAARAEIAETVGELWPRYKTAGAMKRGARE